MKNTLLMLLTVALLSGCASYNKKFKNKPVADIGFFADSTITMLSELDLSVTRDETLLVRRFMHPGEPEEMRVAEMGADLKMALANIVRYSIDIVNIAESDMAETNKVHAYADYLVQFREGVLKNPKIEADTFDNTIEEVMVQTEFIKALQTAQPLLNAVILDGALRVDELINAVEELALKVDGRIDEEYSDIIRYRAKLEREKFDIMTAFEIIYDAYRTDEPNLELLRSSGVIWMPEIIPEGRPSREDLQEIGTHLQHRMEALQAIQQSMKPNWDDYLATQKELDALIDKSLASIRESRILLLTWVRAHQKMASGTTNPAQWFDIGEVTKSLIKGAPSAVL